MEFLEGVHLFIQINPKDFIYYWWILFWDRDFFLVCASVFHLWLSFDSLIVNRKLCPHRCLLNSPNAWLENSGNIQFKSILGMERDKLFFAFIGFIALASCLPFSLFSAHCHTLNAYKVVDLRLKFPQLGGVTCSTLRHFYWSLLKERKGNSIWYWIWTQTLT